MDMGILIIHAIYLGGFENDLGTDLVGTKNSCRVRCKVRVSGTGGKYHHTAFFQMADGSSANKSSATLSMRMAD